MALEVEATQRATIALMISQLLQYNLPKTATILADEADLDIAQLVPSNKIETLTKQQERFQKLEEEEAVNAAAGFITPLPPKEEPPTTSFSCRFTAQHLKPIIAAAFSPDGKFAASGSMDCSIKVLDIEKIHQRYQEEQIASLQHAGQSLENEPALSRALHDHEMQVNDLAFHPTSLVLASCSSDGAIKFFDMQNKSTKRSFRYLNDTLPLHSLCFHPSGEYIFAASNESATIRTFDVKTFQCLRSRDEGHAGGTRLVRASTDGKMYASCGVEGDIKIWDVVSGRCIHTWQGPHAGMDACSMAKQMLNDISVTFSPDNRYLLTSGQDGMPKMWDIATFKQLRTYTGSDCADARLGLLPTEPSLVVGRGERAQDITLWSANHGGDPITTISDAHQDKIFGFACSPRERSFVSYGADQRIKLWTEASA